MTTHKLSLPAAIFINLNIILGTGIFINSAKLAHHLGPWGAVSYAVVGILLLPLILAMAQLVTIHKGGSFYDYACAIHPFVGFMSQWSYFVGKLAACALGIHIFVSFMRTILTPLTSFSPLALDMGVVVLFMLLNMLNVRINSGIQIAFFVLKMIPIMVITLCGIIYFSPDSLARVALNLDQLFVTIPFALYAFTGFEATCSLVHTLERPETDGPKAILYSYALSMVIAISFQTCVYLLIGPELSNADSFLATFPLLFKKIFSDTRMQDYASICIHAAIACSALGAAYGVMFSNAWNLYTLAEKKLLGARSPALWLSASKIPYICMIAESLIIASYLWYTQGAQVALQQTNTLALTITFTLSVCGLVWYSITHARTYLTGALCATGSCVLLLMFLTKNFMHYHTLPSYPFMALIFVGVLIFSTNVKHHRSSYTHGPKKGTL